MNELLEGTKEIPSWMKYGRTVLCQKDSVKGNSVENFRPITCLDMLGIADNVRSFFGEKHEEVETSFEFEWVGLMQG